MSHADAIGSIGARDLEPFAPLLERYVLESGALCVLIVDRTGRLLTLAGDPMGMDETSFASLAAADFADSDQLAQLVGEKEFTALYHNGLHRSMYLADLAGWAVLAALFDSRTTLGMVRIRTRAVVPRLAELLTALANRTEGPEEEREGMEANWMSEAEDSIDRLFAE
jgi:predicted regulator of Ras-like GTPase activity (Roadblock/LC7/MglB family)